MEPLILLLMVAFAVIMVFRSLSRSKRKIRKYTKPLRHKNGYQKPRQSYSQKKSSQGEQQSEFEIASKTKAQSEVAVKEQIKNFPEVKVEHIIDGDTAVGGGRAAPLMRGVGAFGERT